MRLIRLLKNDLAREAAAWVDEEIIDPQQAQAICQRYGADFEQARNSSFAYNILISLGFLFVGVALIILIGANWQEIPRGVRMWGLISLTVSTQLLAVRQYLSNEPPPIGLFLLGNLFFGASIILIAQVYHLGEHMPDGIFWWALGSLPFAVLTRSPWLTLFSLVLGIIWFFVEAGMHFNPVLFPLFILAAIWVLVVGSQSVVLFLTTLFSIGLYLEYNFSEYWNNQHSFDFLIENAVISVGLFILAYAFSYWLRLRGTVKALDYAAVLSVWVLRFALLMLFILSFEEPWRILIKEEWLYLDSLLLLMSLLAALSLLLVRNTNRIKAVAGLCMAYFIILFLLISSSEQAYSLYFQVFDNTVLVLTGVGLIMRGIQHGVSHYFFLGVWSILITGFLRYIDLIESYVGGALLFLFFAAILLAAAKYWKHTNSAQELLNAE